MAAVLHLRGVPVLHASAVAIDRHAIAIAGPSGSGKSTLTAALVAAGAALLADDLSALTFSPAGILVHPGYPRLRIAPEVVAALGRLGDLTGVELPRVFSHRVDADKRYLDVTAMAGGFSTAAAPLRAVYVLRPRRHGGAAWEIARLSRHRACIALLQHLYGAALMRIPPAQMMASAAALANRIAVHAVQAPDGLDRAPHTARAIVNHARCCATSE